MDAGYLNGRRIPFIEGGRGGGGGVQHSKGESSIGPDVKILHHGPRGRGGGGSDPLDPLPIHYTFIVNSTVTEGINSHGCSHLNNIR